MNKKAIAIILGILIFIFGGFYFIGKSEGRSSVPDSKLAKLNPDEVLVSPESYDIGKVLMKDGLVVREYEIKNNSKDPLRVKKIVTSCMCTRAQIIVGDKKTRGYGMEMQGDNNPSINFDIPGETTAKLLVKFDPAFHGPQGAGKISRSVFLTFADPVGKREVKFFGEVTLQ